MLGTRPGIFPSLSLFSQVSRWGSRAPSCFDLCVEFFFSKKKKMKTKFPIEYLLFSFPPSCSVKVFGDREKKYHFFSSSSKRLAIFPEMGCWEHFITEGYWPEICSSPHQDESGAIPVRSPGVLWQAAPLAGCGVSPAEPNSSTGPARAHALCQGTEWV